MARAPALHAEGQRFESVILHLEKEDNDKDGSESIGPDPFKWVLAGAILQREQTQPE